MELSWILQTATTLGVGIIAFFVKTTLNEMKESIKKNNERVDQVSEKLTGEIRNLESRFNDLKEDMPFVYTLREDFIRSMNNMDSQMRNIDSKLDKLINNFKEG